MAVPLTIIGSGLAAWNLARQWRALNPEGELRLIAADGADYYSKPMLSNALAQKRSVESLRIKTCAQMASELCAEVVPHTDVMAIDRQHHLLQTTAGEFAWEQLVLAVGADPFTPPFSGSELPGIMHVNNLDDYGAFHARAAQAERIVLLGGGLIGCEFANDLASQGKQVQVIDLAAWPLNRLLPEVAGQYLQRALQGLGIQFHWQTSLVAAQEHAGALQLTLGNGTLLEADLVLSAVGLHPRTQLAAAAGLEVRRGIVVDQLLRTSDADIYALGDCAEVRGLVLPYVQPLMLAARALAATLSGNATPLRYPAMPVVVKTPACPLVVSPALRTGGEWVVESTPAGIRGLYYEGRDLTAYALLGDAVAERNALSARLPAWMP